MIRKRSKLGSRAKRALASEITVTPLVDVVLVLLIIFLVVAPALARGVPVELPRAAGTEDPPEGAVVVTVRADRTIHLGATPIAREELAARVSRAMDRVGAREVVLRGDAHLHYGEVMAIFAELRAAGIPGVGLAADEPARGTD